MKRFWSSGERVGLVDDALGHRRQLADRPAGAILDLELEAADPRQAPDRRRVEREGARARNRRQPRPHRSEDRVDRLFLPALVPGFQRHEDRAEVRREGARQRIEAAEEVHADHPRRIHQDALDLARHRVGALERGAVRELEAGDEVALILVREEAGGYGPEEEHVRDEERGEDREHEPPARQQRADAAVVAGDQAGEDAVEAAKEGPLVLALPPHQQRAERGGERERVEQRDQHRAGHRQTEVAQHLSRGAGQQRDRDEDGAQHERGRHDRAGDLAHRALHRFAARHALPEQPRDVFHHHDGVVHHQTDREHEREERDRVDPEADRVEHREGADQRDGDGDRGDQRGAPILEEDEDDQEDQQHGREERLDHFGDRLRHELRGVVAHHLRHAGGKALREPLELGAHRRGDLERVGLRHLEDAECRRGLARETRETRVALCAELDARDVAEAQQRSPRLGADHDRLELLDGGEASLRAQREVELLIGRGRRRAGSARGDLHVLLAHRRDHVRGRQPELGQPLGIQPDAHRVAPLAEDPDVADPGQPLQRVENVDQRVVRDEERVTRAVRREQVRHQGELGRHLAHRDAEAPHLLRQTGQRHRHAVVDVDGGDVGVASELEGDGQVHLPVVRAGGRHVEHAFRAVHLFFDRQRDRALDHVGAGARVVGRNLHGRRGDRRELRDREQRDRDRAGQRDQDRHRGREDRTVDEERDEAGRSRARGFRGVGGIETARANDSRNPARTGARPASPGTLTTFPRGRLAGVLVVAAPPLVRRRLRGSLR